MTSYACGVSRRCFAAGERGAPGWRSSACCSNSSWQANGGGGKTGGGGRARAVPLVRAHAWSTARAAAASTLAIPEPAPYEEATPLLTDKRGGALGEPLLPYADVWGARRIFRNRSEGCTLRKDTEAVHWRPGSAARLGRYWDMVVPATEEPTSSR